MYNANVEQRSHGTAQKTVVKQLKLVVKNKFC